MKRTIEIWLNTFLTLFGICALIVALGYKYTTNQGQIGPGFIPVWASAILVGTNLLSIVLILWKKGYAQEGKFIASKQNVKYVLVFFTMIVLYTLGVIYIGMYVSTLVFMVCVYRIFDKMPWKKIVLPVSGTLLFMYLLFSRFLGMMLPAKLLF